MAEQTIVIASGDLGLSPDRIAGLVEAQVLEAFTMPEEIRR